MNSPTSKPFFLSSMLRMSKEHQSAGLRWSLPLNGVGFSSHGSLLGLFNSCFVFPITSLFAANVAANILLEVSTVTAEQWEKPNSFCNNDAWRPVSYLGKMPPLLLLWAPCWKEGENRASCGCLYFSLLDFSEGFSLFFLNYSSKFHIMAADMGLGLSGPAWFLGLINGLRPLPLIFLLPQITRLNLLWALKARYGIFGPGLVW